MISIDDIKKDINLLNSVEWDLNPAVAVGRHLEWGAGWACDDYRARGSMDESIYFAVSTWDDPPMVVLVKRNGFDSEELARFRLPIHIEKNFLESIGYHKGIYGIDDEIKIWLMSKLNIH